MATKEKKKAPITQIKEMLKDKLPDLLKLNIKKGETLSGEELRIIAPRNKEEYVDFYTGVIQLVRDLMMITNIGAKRLSPSGVILFDTHKQAGRPVEFKEEVQNKVGAALSVVKQKGEDSATWWNRVNAQGYTLPEIEKMLEFMPEHFRTEVKGMIHELASLGAVSNKPEPPPVDFDLRLDDLMNSVDTEAPESLPGDVVASAGKELMSTKPTEDSTASDALVDMLMNTPPPGSEEEKKRVRLTQKPTVTCVACGYEGDDFLEEHGNIICPECGIEQGES